MNDDPTVVQVSFNTTLSIFFFIRLCDKVYQLLTHDRWYTPTSKTNRHDIAEILLEVTLKHQKSKINQFFYLHALVIYIYIYIYIYMHDLRV